MSRGVLVVAAVIALAVVAMFALPMANWSAQVADYARDAGATGVLVFAGVYVVATLAPVPQSILTASAGFAFGALAGVLIAWPVSMVAAILGFCLARTVARGWVERRVTADPRLARMERAVSDHGFRLIVLLRLSPVVPFTLLNYVLGLSDIRFRNYVLASLVGMFPGTVVLAYIGSLVPSASALAAGELPDVGPWRTALYVVGLIGTVVVAVALERMARRALAEAAA